MYAPTYPFPVPLTQPPPTTPKHISPTTPLCHYAKKIWPLINLVIKEETILLLVVFIRIFNRIGNLEAKTKWIFSKSKQGNPQWVNGVICIIDLIIIDLLVICFYSDAFKIFWLFQDKFRIWDFLVVGSNCRRLHLPMLTLV